MNPVGKGLSSEATDVVQTGICNLTKSTGRYDTETAWRLLCPILLVLGTVTGVINILVLTRKKVRKSSSATYFLALAIADLIVLHTGLTRQWLIYKFDLDIRAKNDFLCKTNFFIVYLSLQMSSWILVLITVERMVVIQFPYKAKILCTRARALAAILLVFLVLFAVNIHSIIGNITTENHVNSTAGRVCVGITENYHSFQRYYWGWIDLVVFCGLPASIICVLNTVIIVQLSKTYRKRRQIFPTQIIRTNRRQQSFENFTKTWTSTISLLILLDAWFIVCTLPVCVVLVLLNWCVLFYSEDDMQLLWVITNILMYSNNTFNFFLYCISGSRFRKELKLFICTCFRRKVADNKTCIYITPNAN